jgi:hypothetical protein
MLHMHSRAPLLLVGFLACRPFHDAGTSGPPAAAAFTQSFYDWYLASGASLEHLVRDSAQLFDPPLYQALAGDLDAQAHNPDEVVGLDWEPFTASQDPCPAYQVDAPRPRGPHYLVPVRAKCPTPDSGASPGPPTVLVELARRGSRWVFVNVWHGNDPGDLLSDLAELKASRDSAVAPPDLPR